METLFLRNVLLVALLGSSAAFAAPVASLTSQLLGQSAADDDEDDEESDTPTATPAAPAAPTPAAPAPAAPAAQTPAGAPLAPVDPKAQQLVSGAPLFNPNVAVHIVEKKKFSDKGTHEVVLFPLAAQANAKFTQHLGTAATYVYHLQENFGFQVSAQYNWLTAESGFNDELIQKAREQAQAATSLLLVGGMNAGVEVTPLYGKFAFYENDMVHFSLVLNGGAGLGSTRHVIKPADPFVPETYGNTGLKVLGSVGGGFRFQIGDSFALRLEVRDLVYTARVDTVNGCNAQDLGQMKVVDDTGKDINSLADVVSGSCDLNAFSGVDERFTTERGVPYDKTDQISLAKALVETASSDVLNNVSFYAGFGFIF